MSFADCVERAVKGLEIDDESAGRALEYYQKLVRKYQETGEAGAEKLAAAEAAEEMGREAKIKARNKYLKFMATKAIYEQIRDYRTAGRGHTNPKEAAFAIFSNNGLSGAPGIYQIHAEYRKRAYSMLASFMNQQRKNLLGNSSDPEGLANVVDEIFGTDSGDAQARLMAKAWNDTAEWLRLEFNRAGGDIKFRKDWGLPQMHDWLAIRNINKSTWTEYTYGLLDVAKMSELHNMTPDEVRASLDGVYDNIVSNGTKNVDFDSMGFQKATSNSRLDSRFLVFKDSESWMKYQRAYGNGDPFSVMMGHIDMMARDIAIMKKLGPNPENGVEVVKQTVRKFVTNEGLDTKDQIGSVEELTGQVKVDRSVKDPNNYEQPIQDLWDEITGASNVPVNRTAAKAFGNTRQFLTATQLGSAVVSAITDPFFASLTARFNGMPVMRTFKRALSSLDSQSHEQMLRLGLTADSWADSAADMARYHDESLSSPFFQKLSSGVLRASGLNYWTDMMRWSFERELLGFVSENAQHAFKDLPEQMRRSLARYAISPEDWEIIRTTPQYDAGGGAMYLRTQDIAKRSDLARHHADELSLKLASFIDNETNFAVPTSSLRGRAMFGSRGKPGTFWGEFIRSGLMYKNFPLTIILTHMRRSFDESMQGRHGYVTAFMLGTTLMGGLATQLKEMKDGKTPSDMTKGHFWLRAMLQGGGLGIFGDFVIRDHNRYGGGFETTIGGPVVSAANDAFKIGQSLFFDAPIEGEYGPNIAKAGAIASNYIPGRSLWPIAAPYKRAFQDNIRAMGDKKPQRRFKRMIKDRRKNENAGYWWEPGQIAPF